MASGVPLLGPALGVCCLAGAALPRTAVADVATGLNPQNLTPSAPYRVRIGIGDATFLRFSCLGEPADALITLSSYSENADPLLLLSMDPTAAPSFQRYDASSFGQWREDAAGNHYVVAHAMGSRGGILGLVNMRHFSGQVLEASLTIQCNFIVAFDLLFWDHLRSSAICPAGHQVEAGRPVQGSQSCSGHGRCGKHSLCECRDDYAGPACEHRQQDILTAEGHYRFKVATGHYQYFRVRIPSGFPGGFLKVRLHAAQPMVVVLGSDSLPTKSRFNLSNFDDWVNQRTSSELMYKVAASPGFIGASADAVGSVHRDGRHLGERTRKRYVFVGVYNHQRFKYDRDTAHAEADISLTKDPGFDEFRASMTPYKHPTSWIADLYNPFHDVRNLQFSDRQAYPSGQQFVYNFRLTDFETLSMEVRLYHDRLTLLHIENAVGSINMSLDFSAAHNITHVLSSTRGAPKSLFDFDQVHVQVRGRVHISANGRRHIWCAVFGGEDGYVQVQGRAYGTIPSAAIPWGLAFVCALAFVCGLLAVATVFGSAMRLGDWLGVDPDESASFSERIPSLCAEKNIEDQYLHRGGIGDDGM